LIFFAFNVAVWANKKTIGKGIIMDQKTTVLSMTASEMVRLDMILVDEDKDDALAFLKEVRLKIEKSKNKGMKSHLG
jgi:lactam utilization protein B